MACNDHAIMDHCSISWTIDEAFSSRNAKGMTLQHTLISEALNQAGHPNYGAGTRHGYAATIVLDLSKNMYRVLAMTSDNRADADQAKASLAEKYPTAWILINK